MISLRVIVQVVSGPIVWRKLVVALRLRFPTIKQDYEGMDAGEGKIADFLRYRKAKGTGLIGLRSKPKKEGIRLQKSFPY